jgi:nucleoside phosphorylase
MPLSHRDYTVAYICPMGVELAPVKALLDQTHPSLPTQRDQNSYTLGAIGGHNIVIAILPEIGTSSAATVGTQLLNDFPSVRFGLLVGIGGGVPDLANEIDIRLGDIVVSKPTKAAGGVVQYDMGKETVNGFERTGTLNKPPAVLRAAVQQLVAQHELEDSHVPLYLSKMLEKFSKMKEKYTHPGAEHDRLFATAYEHQGGKTCASCDSSQVVRRPPRSSLIPFIHYGTIGSANRVVKNAAQREKLKSGDLDIMCVEMEAAGLMDSFPCLVIRGICDYADSHKNQKWQPYAAAAAAAYMKEILSIIPAQEVTKVPHATSVVQIPRE